MATHSENISEESKSGKNPSSRSDLRATNLRSDWPMGEPRGQNQSVDGDAVTLPGGKLLSTFPNL